MRHFPRPELCSELLSNTIVITSNYYSNSITMVKVTFDYLVITILVNYGYLVITSNLRIHFLPAHRRRRFYYSILNTYAQISREVE